MDRLCLSAPCQLLHLWSGINHLISPQGLAVWSFYDIHPHCAAGRSRHITLALSSSTHLPSTWPAYGQTRDVFMAKVVFLFVFKAVSALVHSLSSINPAGKVIS